MEDNPVLIYPVDDEDRNTENESKLSKGILKNTELLFRYHQKIYQIYLIK